MTSRLPAWAGGRIMNLSVSVRLPCLPACRRLRKLQVYLRCLQVYLPACTCVVCKCTCLPVLALFASVPGNFR